MLSHIHKTGNCKTYVGMYNCIQYVYCIKQMYYIIKLYLSVIIKMETFLLDKKGQFIKEYDAILWCRKIVKSIKIGIQYRSLRIQNAHKMLCLLF